jgi:hypothetical protein
MSALTRATMTARRAALHAELLEAMRIVERYRGALALLDELLELDDPARADGAREIDAA